MLLSLLVAATVSAAPVADTLTANDLLDVATATVADLSDDGRWIALTVSQRRDALGVVAARTGDPTYIQQANIELFAVDARTLARTPVFAGKRPVRGATWSPDASRLAYLEVVNERFRLVVWERATGRTTVSRLAPGTYVAESSELRWNGAGTALYFALRRDAWRTATQERFANLVTGPITHLSGQDKEPFLPWEALRREGNRRAIAAWTPAAQRVEVLIPEAMIGDWQVSPDGTVRVWNDDVTPRTDYETIMGRSERLLARVGADTVDRVLMPTLRNTTVQWTEDARRYFYTRDGAIWMARVPDASGTSAAPRAPGADTTRRRIAAADSVPASDTTKAARDRRARTRWSLVRTAPRGDAVIASRMDGLYLIDTLGALTRIAAMPDSTDRASARPSVVQWSHDGRWVYLAMNARDRYDRAIVRWDRTSGSSEPLARDANYRTGLTLSKDASTLTMNVASANRPADPHVADASLGNVRRLHDANPHLTAARVARTELIRYLDVDGKPQWGVVYHPTNGQRNAPAVFIVYEEFFDDTFDPQANYLASRGYAVVKPSVGFETGYPGEAWLKGVTAAANHVITMGIADSGRLAVQGQSYGGYAVNLIVTQTKRFKAAVNVSGKVDLISFYTDSPRLGDRNTHAAERSQDRIGATMWEAPMKYLEHSAVMFADRIATPVLLMTGGEDHNVPAINTREMYYALRRLGKPVEWVNYANGGHGVPMTEAREFIHYHETLAAWYDRHLRAPAVPIVP
jgi:dipeptidyl aminopeptidase/acylaminoacyl peptidase